MKTAKVFRHGNSQAVRLPKEFRFDDDEVLMYFTNRKPGFEKIARRMSGRLPGEMRLSAITLAELGFGIARGEFHACNRSPRISLA